MTDYYVRPLQDEDYGTGDGLSYTNAFDGFVNITEALGGGDTIFICGVHDNQNYAHPPSGDPGNPLIISGNYPDDPGIIQDGANGITLDKPRYIIFEHLVLKRQWSAGGIVCNIAEGAQDLEFRYLTFYRQLTKGLQMMSSGEVFVEWVENIWIHHCDFYDIGIWDDTAANSVGFIKWARHCIVEDCRFRGTPNAYGVDGVLIQLHNGGGGSGHIVRRNQFYAMSENALDLKGVNNLPGIDGPTQFYDSVIVGCAEPGLVWHFGTRDVEVFRNIWMDNYHGCAVAYKPEQFQGDGSVRIAYNIFYDTRGRTFADGDTNNSFGDNQIINNTFDRPGWDGRTASFAVHFQTLNNVCYNNIFDMTENDRTPFCGGSTNANSEPSMDRDYNGYHQIGSTRTWTAAGDQLQVHESDPLGGWNEDPQFVDKSVGNYSLQSTSPGRNGSFPIDLGEMTDHDVFGRSTEGKNHQGAVVGPHPFSNVATVEGLPQVDHYSQDFSLRRNMHGFDIFRDSINYAWDMAGHLQVSNPNEPVWVIGGGFQYEYEGVNLVPDTDNMDLDSGPWEGDGDVTCIFADVRNPVRDITTCHRARGTTGRLYFPGIIVPTEGVLSIYVRAASGSGDIHVLGENTDPNSQLVTIDSDWQRFSAPASATDTDFVAIDFDGSSTLEDIYVWIPQYENSLYANEFVTSVIHSDGVPGVRPTSRIFAPFSQLNGLDAPLVNDFTVRLVVTLRQDWDDIANSRTIVCMSDEEGHYFEGFGFARGGTRNLTTRCVTQGGNIATQVLVAGRLLGDTVDIRMVKRSTGIGLSSWVVGSTGPTEDDSPEALSDMALALDHVTFGNDIASSSDNRIPDEFIFQKLEIFPWAMTNEEVEAIPEWVLDTPFNPNAHDKLM